ncbi:MAG: site-2 protease family protein, partial [Lachnospiraceae bacterium]|nr:site-2 protease family protein [Lachnospiraceae bacterium]
LGFLVLIHEGGHFLFAKLCKIKVNEFAIGFGPTIWKKQTKETKYALRAIPLGGFVNMEGEEKKAETEGSFSEASILKRIIIVAAGGLVNILFGLLLYFILLTTLTSVYNALLGTWDFAISIIDSLKILFTGQQQMNQLIGPVGISGIISNTSGFQEYIYILSVISLSLGVTNLLPFPPLDGGKILLLLVEGIRRKPLKEDFEIKVQMLGFAALIVLSIFVTYNDILKVF